VDDELEVVVELELELAALDVVDVEPEELALLEVDVEETPTEELAEAELADDVTAGEAAEGSCPV
jgi:hypothetical protein